MRKPESAMNLLSIALNLDIKFELVCLLTIYLYRLLPPLEALLVLVFSILELSSLALNTSYVANMLLLYISL